MVVAPIHNAYELEKLFVEYGRGSQFSFEALKVLFDLLERMSEDSGSDEVVDVIALCCEYAEYDDIDDYNEQNSTDFVDWEEVIPRLLWDGCEENWTFERDGKIGAIVQHG
jgi:hypothetical protein